MFFKNFKKFFNLRKSDQNGFTLVEMIVAMGIMAIVTPFMITMVANAVQIRDNSESARKNILASNSVNAMLSNDIKTSGYTEVINDGKSLKVRTTDGKCVLWEVKEVNKTIGDGEEIMSQGLIRSAANEPARDPDNPNPLKLNPSDLNEFVVSDSVNSPIAATDRHFSKVSNGLIEYQFPVGDKSSKLEISGSMKAQVLPSGPGLCW